MNENRRERKGVKNLFFSLHIWQRKKFPPAPSENISLTAKFVPIGVKCWHKFGEVYNFHHG